MAAIHQSMAAVHQSLVAPSPLSVFGREFSSRPSPSPVRRSVPKPVHRHIWIVAGTSCCGKTTIATNLSRRLGAGEYIEGDDFHPEANKLKMSSGRPLTDEDRAPWLRKLKSIAVSRLDIRGSTNVVLTCSALKAQYRDVFREVERTNPDIQVHFLFLMAPEGVLVKRAASRPGHFFKGADMIKSQFAVLEMPDHHVETDVMTVDCTKPEDIVEDNVLGKVHGVLAADSK